MIYKNVANFVITSDVCSQGFMANPSFNYGRIGFLNLLEQPEDKNVLVYVILNKNQEQLIAQNGILKRKSPNF